MATNTHLLHHNSEPSALLTLLLPAARRVLRASQAAMSAPLLLRRLALAFAALSLAAPACPTQFNATMDGWFGWSDGAGRNSPADLCLRVEHAPAPPAGCRFWTQADLQRARGVTHYAGLRPIFTRLRAGKPITIAAFGSSITSNSGGCFHSDLDYMRSRLDNLPLNFMGNPTRSLCLPGSPFRVGFASLLLAAINKTWPNPAHLLVNTRLPSRWSPFWNSPGCRACPCTRAAPPSGSI